MRKSQLAAKVTKDVEAHLVEAQHESCHSLVLSIECLKLSLRGFAYACVLRQDINALLLKELHKSNNIIWQNEL